MYATIFYTIQQFCYNSNSLFYWPRALFELCIRDFGKAQETWGNGFVHFFWLQRRKRHLHKTSKANTLCNCEQFFLLFFLLMILSNPQLQRICFVCYGCFPHRASHQSRNVCVGVGVCTSACTTITVTSL